MSQPTEGVLRTPEERFANLTDWPFAPQYVDDLPGYAGLRIHYVDEGPKDADRVFFCLHGEPTWAYLFRKMMPEFLASGARVVAPDMLGFGRSDKPVSDETYGFHFHRNMLMAFLDRMALQNVTFVVQDWGGLLGLTLPVDRPEITRILIMNTALAVGKPAGEGFNQWRAWAAANPDMDVAALMQRATPILSDAEAAAYGAPFPGIDYKAGVRRFPQMVMTDPGMEGIETSKRAANFLRTDWQGDTFMAIGMQDPVLGPPAMAAMQKLIRNCPDPMQVADAGHFVQEWGGPIAKAALKHWGDI